MSDDLAIRYNPDTSVERRGNFKHLVQKSAESTQLSQECTGWRRHDEVRA